MPLTDDEPECKEVDRSAWAQVAGSLCRCIEAEAAQCDVKTDQQFVEKAAEQAAALCGGLKTQEESPKPPDVIWSWLISYVLLLLKRKNTETQDKLKL